MLILSTLHLSLSTSHGLVYPNNMKYWSTYIISKNINIISTYPVDDSGQVKMLDTAKHLVKKVWHALMILWSIQLVTFTIVILILIDRTSLYKKKILNLVINTKYTMAIYRCNKYFIELLPDPCWWPDRDLRPSTPSQCTSPGTPLDPFEAWTRLTNQLSGKERKKLLASHWRKLLWTILIVCGIFWHFWTPLSVSHFSL